MKYTKNGALKAAFAMVLAVFLVVGCARQGETPAKDPKTPKEADIPLKDDFYAATNREWLNKTEIPPGQAETSAFDELERLTEERIEQFLESLNGQGHNLGSKERKLSAFYTAAADVENRNAQGAAPVRKYLEGYDNAKDLAALIRADAAAGLETGSFQLFRFAVENDCEDSSSHVIHFYPMYPRLSKDMYKNEAQAAAFRRYIASVLELSGETREQAEERARTAFEFEKQLSALTLNPEEYYDIDKTNNRYSLGELEALYTGAGISDMLKSHGFQPPEIMVVADKALAEGTADLFIPENLETLKAYAKASFLLTFGSTLSTDFQNASNAFDQAAYGVQGAKTNTRLAVEATKSAFPDYLGQMYAESFFSEAAREEIEAMVAEFVEIYKAKIRSADWLSGATKEKAVKKLETLMVKIGYPDDWPDTLDGAVIKTYAEGGSYFTNVCAVGKANFEENVRKQGKPVDRGEWHDPAFTVNAYYNPFNNEIVFPAGILQPPFYGVNAERAANLGGIGVVIAHEITHAFDNNGAKFDELGNAANWWTGKDYANFDALCQKVSAFYDGVEIAPGIVSDGGLTLSENVADLGGLSCALIALSRDENPDYEAFFKAYASIWRTVKTRERTEYLSNADVHSNAKLRVNRAVANFQPFHNTFGVTEGDGMYVPTEERVAVW